MTEDNLLTEENENAITVPEKFRDPESGELRVDALLKSYMALEKKLSGMAQNIPSTADEYDINVDNGLLEVDPDVNQRLHEKGFTVEQVQEVYDLAAEKLVPAILEMAQEFEADREVERLTKEFGGPEKWAEVSRQLLAFGRKNLAADVFENLSSSFDGVMALYRMMKSEEPELSVRDVSAKMEGEDDLRSMMRDPRYWREKDPAFVAKVTDGFQRMYGNK